MAELKLKGSFQINMEIKLKEKDIHMKEIIYQELKL